MNVSDNSLTGKTLKNRYLVEEELGRGAFGITYKAIDQDVPKKPCVVVKQLKTKYSDPTRLDKAKRLFDKEAKSLEQLGRKSDQIPELFAHFEEHGEFYLVQEFIDGYDLTKEIIPEKKLNEKQVIKLLKDILEVLAFVHEQDIIHRDLKRQNIIRRKEDGKIVLIDFGAVKKIKTVESIPQSQDYKTAVVGTPGYMPIEQERDQAQFCSDIYAVGMIAIQALTGLGIREIAAEVGEVTWRKFAPEVSNELADIIDKMVRYDFQQRYQSAEEVLRALNSPIINLLELDQKYLPLCGHLQNQNWQEADRETVNLMLKEANREQQGFLDMNSLESFPCEVLKMIDDLWVKYSNGKFGFSIQAAIWKEILGNSQADHNIYREFGKRIGWVKRNEIIWYDNLTFDIDEAPKGHLPVGRFGNISLLKKLSGWFGGFGLERIEAMVEKLRQCDIIE